MSSRRERLQMPGCGAQARSGADDVEGGAPGTRVLARRRDEPAVLDACDRRRQLRLEHGHVPLREDGRDGGVRALEEVVDDFDLTRAAAEAGKRVAEPLEPVVLLDDLVGGAVADDVRL